jgi:gas vesicle protein
MRDVFKKDPSSETDKIELLKNEQEMSQTSEEPEQVVALQNDETSNNPGVLDLLESFQKMRTEEQKLFEIKQHLLTTQQDLQSRLVKEIDKKKIAIDNLKSEIPDLQNRCKQLGQVLGIDS